MTGGGRRRRRMGRGPETISAGPRYATAPRSPWQNPYCERLIGSIRREVLDHVIVLNERHLRRLLTAYISYYHRFRTHLSLAMDCSQPRAVEPPEIGKVI